MLKRLLPFLIAAVPGFIDRGLALSDYHSVALSVICWSVAALILVGATINAIHEWHQSKLAEGRPGVQSSYFLLAALTGAWLSLGLALGVTAWMVFGKQGFIANAGEVSASDDGPMKWFRNLEMEGGPRLSQNVFALTFQGFNSSQSEVELKKASIISAVNGSQIPLEIVAEGEIISLNEAELIPPGAPVQLVAKFGPPDPNLPNKIMGIEPKKFIETWRQFSLNIQDSSKSYRSSFNENDLAPFFPGMVGPHVSKKVAATDKSRPPQ